MAVPSTLTVGDLQGQFSLNKKLSDDSKEFFVLQGLSWVTRKAIGLANVKLTMKNYKEGGVTHIDTNVVASGMTTTPELRAFDWKESEYDDKLFGKCKVKSRFFKGNGFEPSVEIDDVNKKFLLGEQLKDGTASSWADDDHIQTVGSSVKDGWIVEQVWGFETVDGVKRHTRRMIVRNNGKTERMRLVYDYIGA